MPFDPDVFQALEEAALSYPEVVEEAPWGHRVMKVNKKMFLFLEQRSDRLALNCKLPLTSAEALEHGFATPMGYGMGKHGWVCFDIDDSHGVSTEELLAWIDESYRAIAGRRQLRILDSGERPAPPPITHRADGKVLVLVGSDHLRRGRAQAELEARGAEVASCTLEEALDLVGAAVPHGVMVDLSRDATAALALLPELGLATDGAPLAVVGVRDAKMERAVRALASFPLVSRDAPGEHEVVEAFAALVG